MYKRYAIPFAFALLPSLVHAEDRTFERVVIIGTQEDAQSLAGSGAVVDAKQMKTEVITDVNQALKTVPGVYIREEDGFGLRPNIGIRGATGERSANITLMEDGVMTAPAPYGDPAAYYFPTTARMSSIEVLKGAPLLRYGPQTTGGVINMVSTPIPTTNSGQATFSFGSHGAEDLHVNYGGREGQWSWLLETVQRNNDGFKDIDRSHRDSGFDISDYVVKLGWESTDKTHSLLLKAQHSEETSDETYLGLTDRDFARDPNRRYGVSSIDQMTNDHTGVSLVHTFVLNDSITATTRLYHNDFARDWFKLDGAGSLINAANNGDANAQGILDGAIDTTGLRYKHNNREYFSQGIDFNLDIDLGLHLLSVGARAHEDEVDRFQPVEVFNQVNGSLVFNNIIQPGSGDNRIGSAEALTFWIQDNWQITEQLNANINLRYEDVDNKEVRYTDLDRTLVNRTTASDTREWLPGVSLTYDINEHWQVLAGVHKGFTPLGASGLPNEDPETSTNWETGVRYRTGASFAEVVAFYSDFSNKVEHCSVGTPCSNGETSGSFKTGEAVIAGLEYQLGTEFRTGNFTLPLTLSYTYTQAEISTDNDTAGVRDGDELKDVPENTFSARFGVEHTSGWNQYLVAKYLDETCVAIGCNRLNSPRGTTDSLFVVDVISRYPLSKTANVFLKIENIFDEQKIVSRDPDGARPNKPLSASLGITVGF
ncbi:TonB-dependent receptor family protein [Cellvibrio sp. ARAG 10.3]|uniref:TonB-dependent receptor family protein n=1 Tax=Cellvibrio sp. ARAG 10.3 TaxID=3451358 RepID=UPI003F4820FC